LIALRAVQRPEARVLISGARSHAKDQEAPKQNFVLNFMKAVLLKRRFQEAAMLVTLLLISSHHSFSQDIATSYISTQALTTGNILRTYDSRFKGSLGDVKLFEQYVPGKLYMSQGQVIELEVVNYDAFSDELLVKRGGKEMVVSTPMVRRFVLQQDDGDTLCFVRMARPDGKDGFYQKLAAYPNVGVYKRIYKTVSQPPTDQYIPDRSYAEIKRREQLVLIGKAIPLTEFKNKKTLLSHFPQHQSAIEKYIKEEKIDFKDDSDLRKLFYFIDQQLN
jgi:hypothetical protein